MLTDLPVTHPKESRLSQVDFHNIQFGKVYSDHMFIADYVDGEWVEPRIVPFGNIPMTPANATLHYGQTVFEGMKAHKSPEGDAVLFRARDNYERMRLSAKRMCMPEVPEELFLGGLERLLKEDKVWVPDVEGTSLYIRPFMFAADEYIGIRPSSNYRFMIFTCPVGAYYNAPVKVKVEEHYVRAWPGGTGFAKTAANYAIALEPAIKAKEQGYDQLIWTDGIEHKFIEESGTMNICFKIDDRLITPKSSDTILSGITRRSVVDLARHWGLRVEERQVTVAEVMAAADSGRLQEAFGAGTAATIAHIESIGFQGKDYVLPPVESRVFSHKVLKALDDIKHGRGEDPFGWTVKV